MYKKKECEGPDLLPYDIKCRIAVFFFFSQPDDWPLQEKPIKWWNRWRKCWKNKKKPLQWRINGVILSRIT